jgi:hypothetical protein
MQLPSRGLTEQSKVQLLRLRGMLDQAFMFSEPGHYILSLHTLNPSITRRRKLFKTAINVCLQMRSNPIRRSAATRLRD